MERSGAEARGGFDRLEGRPGKATGPAAGQFVRGETKVPLPLAKPGSRRQELDGGGDVAHDVS